MSSANGARSMHRLPGREERTTDRGRLREVRAMVHLLAPFRWGALAGIAATVMWSILGLVPAYLTKVLIDDGIDDSNRAVIGACAAVSAALVVVMWALMIVQKYYLYDVAYRAVVSMQHALFARVVRLPPLYHDRHPVGQTVSRLTNDVWASRRLITTGLPTLITSSVSAIGALVLMLILDWDMALITLAVLPVLVVISWVYRHAARPLFGQMRAAIGGVTDAADETLGEVELIQSYDQAARHRAQFDAAVTASRSAEYRTIVAGSIYFPATSILTSTATGLLIIYGGVQVVRGNSEVGTMVAFFGYVQMFLHPIAGFSSVFASYQSGVAALTRVFEVEDEPIEPDPDRTVVLDDDSRGTIDLVDLSLTTSERRVRDALDVNIPAGSIVAFVGDDDSGRDQIGPVIAGLVEPDAGRVLLDRVASSRVTRASLRAHIGYVSPNTGLFDATVGDNLRLAAPDASDRSLTGELERLFGSGFVAGLPDGLDTPAGRNGRNLPRGARQAIVITRVVLRRPRILVLDGSADALDADLLSRLTASRTTALRGVTVVIVTNRPLIASHVDEVAVLDAGRIVERGTSTDLVAAGGMFAEMAEPPVGDPRSRR